MKEKNSTFEKLIDCINEIDGHATSYAKTSVNSTLTIRNWLIGYYIVEFEQNGEDRAKYGDKLLDALEKSLNKKGLNKTLFKFSRLFYLRYPQISSTLSDKFAHVKLNVSEGMLLDLDNIDKKENRISSTVSNLFKTDANELISKLSFSHIREILAIDDPFERFFYETECIKCTWSVRELRRQIATNMYVRTGISKNPDKLIKRTNIQSENRNINIKDPFIFEFLGIGTADIVSESDLEGALIDHLQEFILELGKGFCFEAKQKRIIIDDRYYFADLVFYNRILHCNVIVELKNDEFKHEYLGQLNAYVGYYKENEMNKGDNEPIGILLCTQKGTKMVEYALSGMSNEIFVSTYMLQLPDKEQLENFIIKEVKEMGL